MGQTSTARNLPRGRTCVVGATAAPGPMPRWQRCHCQCPLPPCPECEPGGVRAALGRAARAIPRRGQRYCCRSMTGGPLAPAHRRRGLQRQAALQAREARRKRAGKAGRRERTRASPAAAARQGRSRFVPLPRLNVPPEAGPPLKQRGGPSKTLAPRTLAGKSPFLGAPRPAGGAASVGAEVSAERSRLSAARQWARLAEGASRLSNGLRSPPGNKLAPGAEKRGGSARGAGRVAIRTCADNMSLALVRLLW